MEEHISPINSRPASPVRGAPAPQLPRINQDLSLQNLISVMLSGMKVLGNADANKYEKNQACALINQIDADTISNAVSSAGANNIRAIFANTSSEAQSRVAIPKTLGTTDTLTTDTIRFFQSHFGSAPLSIKTEESELGLLNMKELLNAATATAQQYGLSRRGLIKLISRSLQGPLKLFFENLSADDEVNIASLYRDLLNHSAVQSSPSMVASKLRMMLDKPIQDPNQLSTFLMDLLNYCFKINSGSGMSPKERNLAAYVHALQSLTMYIQRWFPHIWSRISPSFLMYQNSLNSLPLESSTKDSFQHLSELLRRHTDLIVKRPRTINTIEVEDEEEAGDEDATTNRTKTPLPSANKTRQINNFRPYAKDRRQPSHSALNSPLAQQSFRQSMGNQGRNFGRRNVTFGAQSQPRLRSNISCLRCGRNHAARNCLRYPNRAEDPCVTCQRAGKTLYHNPCKEAQGNQGPQINAIHKVDESMFFGQPKNWGSRQRN